MLNRQIIELKSRGHAATAGGRGSAEPLLAGARWSTRMHGRAPDSGEGYGCRELRWGWGLDGEFLIVPVTISRVYG